MPISNGAKQYLKQISMIVLNPQWQGSGLIDELRIGTETLKAYFKDYTITEIPLSTKDLK